MSFLRESWNVAFKCRNLVLKFTYDSGFQRTRLTTRFFHATENHHAAADHYSALKVPRGATQAQIKSAYYKLCMEHHPDTSLGCPTKAREEFAKISEAYAVLGQVESRRKYDKEHLQQYPNFDEQRSPEKTNSLIHLRVATIPVPKDLNSILMNFIEPITVISSNGSQNEKGHNLESQELTPKVAMVYKIFHKRLSSPSVLY